MLPLRQRRLCDLLQNNDESEEDILQSIEFLGIPLNSQTHYAVLVLRLQPKSKWLTMGSMPEKDRITFSMALEELFARVLAEYGVNVVFKGRLSEYIAILDVEHDEYEEDLLSVAEHLQARIRSEMKLDTMIGISEPFRGLRSVRSAYANACEAISRCYLIGKDIPISIKNMRTTAADALFANKRKKRSVTASSMEIRRRCIWRWSAPLPASAPCPARTSSRISCFSFFCCPRA